MERRGQKPLDYISGPEEYLDIWSQVPIKVREGLANDWWRLPEDLSSFPEDRVMVRLYIDTSFTEDLKGRRVVIMREREDGRALLAEWAVVSRRFMGGDGVARLMYNNPVSGDVGLVVEESKLMAIGLPFSREGERAI